MDAFTDTRTSLERILREGEIGDRIENEHMSRSVSIIDHPRERYQMAKGGMVAGLTNHESVAINFLLGG